MKKIYSLLLITIFLTACGDKIKYAPIDTDSTPVLKAEILCEDVLVGAEITNIQLYKDLILAYSTMTGAWLRIYDKKGDIQKNFVRDKGYFVYDSYQSPPVITSDEEELFVYDCYDNVAYRYKLDSIAADSTIFSTDTIRVNVKQITNFIPAADNRYVGKYSYNMNDNNDARFAILEKGKISSVFGELPDTAGVGRNMMFNSIASSFVATSPDMKKMVSATRYGAILEIFDISKTIERKAIKYICKPSTDTDTSPTHLPEFHTYIIGFTGIEATNDRIFTTYLNQLTMKSEYMSSIVIFDWDGNVSKIFRTEYDIKCFSYNEAEQVIYALVKRANNKAALVKFELPK